MLYLYPYKMGSASAKALREGLSSSLNRRVKMVHPDGRFKPKRGDKVINWGNSTIPNWHFTPGVDLNHPQNISIAANKRTAFEHFVGYNTANESHIAIPRWTTNRDEAQTWLNNGSTIVVRNILNGHSGRGIEIVQEGTLQQAPLFVEYKKKRFEYRVHVFKGEVIDTQQKRKRNADERPDTFNSFVRNHDNGWVYCRDDIATDIFRDALAIIAVQALALDFGAADIIYNQLENQNYVLEVNTAPGLEGTTLEKYVEVLTR